MAKGFFFMDRTISSFLEHLIVEKGFSRNTSDAYRNDLSQFWAFLQNHSNGSSNGSSNGNTHHNQNSHVDRSSNDNAIWTTVDINVLNKYIEDLRVRKGYRDTLSLIHI